MEHTLIQRRIVTGVAAYLEYEYSCGMGYGFSERTLTLPVYKILKSLSLNNWDNTCAQDAREGRDKLLLQTEYPEPLLNKHVKRRGKKKSVDFMWRGEAGTTYYLEHKFFGFTDPKNNKVTEDIERLHFIADQAVDCRAMFLASGWNDRILATIKKLSSMPCVHNLYTLNASLNMTKVRSNAKCEKRCGWSAVICDVS